MYKTNGRHEVMEVMEVLTGPGRRRRWSAEEKAEMVRQSWEPIKTASGSYTDFMRWFSTAARAYADRDMLALAARLVLGR